MSVPPDVPMLTPLPDVSQPALQRELQAVRQVFIENRRWLGEGKAIDLSGLDQRLQRLCLSLEHTAPEIHRQLLPDCRDLLALLDALALELRTAHERAIQKVE
jgi:hypothetical protein